MRARILCLCLSVFAAGGVSAKLISHYRMDSFALLSDAVALCDEVSVQIKKTPHEKWAETTTIVQCRVVRSFKGDLPPDAGFGVEYGSLYSRVLPGDEGYTLMNAKGKVEQVVESKYLPPGRALLFLKHDAAANAYTIVTAKLITPGGSVYQFGQFQANPGGLVLAPQPPENIQLFPAQKYGEAELIEDLLAALEKAAHLPAPVPLNPFDALK